jgi:tRNA(fMet)-specific endonuclease VapC
MRYLLDANAVIALLNDATSGLAQRTRREKPEDMAISAIVAHELFYGAFKSRRATQNVALIDALQFAVLEFDREDARQAGEVRAFLAAKGTPIGPYDVLIAGQAMARNMILVTRNTGEFGRVPGLRIDDWQGSA